MKREESTALDQRRLTPLYARYLIRAIRPFPDADPPFIKPVRQRAAQLLQLKPGDRVLDVGCGPGASFPYLVDAVGPTGEVVGVEISPEIAINARRRVEKNRWSNVRVTVADARSVQLEGEFDGLLAFAAADTYASAEVLANLLPFLKDDGHVVAFGAKLSRQRLGLIFNPVLRALWNLTFSSTPRLSYEPWEPLENRLLDFHVEEYFFGCMFLAWGRKK